MLSETGAEGRSADSYWGSFAGGCETCGTIWRWILSGARRDSQVERTVRDDELRGRESRARSEEDRTLVHGASASGGVEGARGYRNLASRYCATGVRCRGA